MSSHFAIHDRLAAKHWPAFQRLMLKRTLTMEQATRWLNDRGCVVCKSAVARYIKLRREDPRQRVRQELFGATSDVALRATVAESAAKLSGVQLAQLVLIAGYLLSSQAANRDAGESERRTAKRQAAAAAVLQRRADEDGWPARRPAGPMEIEGRLVTAQKRKAVWSNGMAKG